MMLGLGEAGKVATWRYLAGYLNMTNGQVSAKILSCRSEQY